MSRAPEFHPRFVNSLAAIPAAAWDACANPPGQSFNPFVSHAFLQALEASGCVSEAAGWKPCHLAIEDTDGRLIGAMPLYLKTHSYGEYVFDQAWARGYEAAGRHYYPKLLSGVPFTPVPGPRLLIHPDADGASIAQALIEAAMAFTREHRLSSLHVNFLSPQQRLLLARPDWLLREGRQYHFDNPGFASFDDYLGSLNARRRKAVRKERREALASGLTIHHLTGSEIEERHWDAFFRFYMDTGARKWGSPYLNRRCFSLLGEAMSERLLLMLAYRGKTTIAGALHLVGGDTLYGRYWGMSEYHPSLHFELCYYQAIEYAIAHRLRRVEAGAQGEHKLARGYLPTPTYSAHFLPDPGFRRAVEHFIASEQAYIVMEDEALTDHSPFRRGGDSNETGTGRETGKEES